MPANMIADSMPTEIIERDSSTLPDDHPMKDHHLNDALFHASLAIMKPENYYPRIIHAIMFEAIVEWWKTSKNHKQQLEKMLEVYPTQCHRPYQPRASQTNRIEFTD